MIVRLGMKYGAQYLLRACENGAEDMDAREGMCMCSLLGGLSLANAKLGAWDQFLAAMSQRIHC